MPLLVRVHHLLAALALLLPLALVRASDARRHPFDIPAGAARPALRQFAAQGNCEIVFPVASVDGIKTNAIRGEMSARTALEQMLAGTGLMAARDARTGAFAIRHEATAPAKKPAPHAQSGNSTPLPPAKKKEPEPMTNKPRSLLGAFAAWVAVSAAADAQTASATAPAGNPDELIKLNEFVVTAADERGYLAGNSISGTRTNTALKDLPINIAVITEEVLKDTNAVVPTDALAYSASVQVTVQTNLANQAGPLNFDGQIFIRGTSTFFNLRNGFRTYDNPSAISTQRIEVVKGPASVLYGVTKPGGVANTITKQAEFGRTFGRIGASYGSYATTRSTLDVNYGKLAGGKVAVRLAGSYTDAANQFDYTRGSEWAAYGTVAYKPFERTRVALTYDYVVRNRPSNNGNFYVRTPPAVGGVPYIGAQVPFFIYPVGPADPVATLNPQVPAGFDPEFNFRGPAQQIKAPANNVELSITQLVTDNLSLNFQAQRNRRETGFDGFNTAAAFTGTALPGDPAFPRITRQYQRSVNFNDLNNYVATAIYKRDLSLPLVGAVKNKFVVGVSRLEENFETRQINEYVPGTNTRISYFIPFSPSAFLGRPANYPTGDVRRNPPSDAAENNDYDVGYASWAGEFFKSRLILNAGATRTAFYRRREGAGASRLDDNGNSPLIGAIVRPLSWLGFFVQKSKSLNPNSAARDGFNNALPPERGAGTEIGVKFELFGGRLSGSAGAFDISEFNRALNDPNAPRLTSFYLDAAGNPQPISGPDDPRYNPNLPGQIRGALVAAGETKSRGFDTDFTFSVNRAFQFIGSYAYLDAFVKRDVNNSLGTLIGRPLPNSYYHRFALLGKYKFSEGPLKGLDVVLGTNWRSRVFVDTINADQTSTAVISRPTFRYAKPVWGGDFKLGYHTRILERRWDFSLNVGNIFETEMRAGWVPRVPYADTPYYYKTPRTYTFSTGVSF